MQYLLSYNLAKNEIAFMIQTRSNMPMTDNEVIMFLYLPNYLPSYLPSYVVNYERL